MQGGCFEEMSQAIIIAKDQVSSQIAEVRRLEEKIKAIEARTKEIGHERATIDQLLMDCKERLRVAKE